MEGGFEGMRYEKCDMGDIPDFARRRVLDFLPPHDKIIFGDLCKNAVRNTNIHLHFGSNHDENFEEQFKKNFLKKIFGYVARCEFLLKLGLRFWIL